MAVRYAITIDHLESDELTRTRKFCFKDSATHRQLLYGEAGKGSLQTVFPALMDHCATAVIHIKDDEDDDYGLDEKVETGKKYFIRLKEYSSEKDVPKMYQYILWGTNAERTATLSGDVSGTVHGATASGGSSAHNAPTTSLSSGASTASGPGAVASIQAHTVNINVGNKEASSPPKFVKIAFDLVLCGLYINVEGRRLFLRKRDKRGP
eukprot:m.293771 g.293771  ORF g.293771 m.293771 type:complete len:209 (+) comp40740_c1_seq11:29-655(+)